MWKKTSFVLLFALLASTANAQTARAATGSKDVVFTVPVEIDGSHFGEMQLLRGESYDDAAVAFARKNGLFAQKDDTDMRDTIAQLSSFLRDKVERAQAAAQGAPRTVQLSFTLNIGQQAREFKKYADASVHESVERFLYDGGYPLDMMRELYPQIVDVVNQKLAEIQPARKELFAFTVNTGNGQLTVRHFEDGNPEQEAVETLRSAGLTSEAFLAEAVPQIADAIRQRMPQPAPQPPQQQQAAPPLKELFSIPLMMNERPSVLVHYDGYTSRESAMRYLRENDAEGNTAALGQLTQVIDNRVAELARERAEQEAAARARAEAEAAAAAARQAAATQRQPLVRLSIEFGNNQAAALEYFEGDSVERTAELFLANVIGLKEGPAFTQNVASLSDAIRRDLAAKAQQQPAPPVQQEQNEPPQPPREPFVQLPVTLGGRVFDLVYYAGEQPATVANTFCVEKHETIRAELGIQFDGDELLECKNLLESTLNNMIAQKQEQPQEAPPQPPAQPAAQESRQLERGELLVSLNIGINGNNVALPVHRGDNLEQITRAFCQQHGVAMTNVPALVEGMKAELAHQGLSA